MMANHRPAPDRVFRTHCPPGWLPPGGRGPVRQSGRALATDEAARSRIAQEFATTLYNAQKAIIAGGVADPTIGYYSATYSGKGITIGNDVISAFNDVVLGRRPLSDYNQIVKDWSAAGGDQIR